jgi:hypothetical protein
MTDTIMKAVVTTECTCEVYDEVTDKSTPSEDCHGCWDDNQEDFTENFLPEWESRHGITNTEDIVIWSEAMGWDNRSGHAICKVGTIVDTLAINGQYRLDFEYDPESGNLTCTRYSHDEPMGALFKVGYLRDIEESE